MLQHYPKQPVPSNCGECEFSFDISDGKTKNLVACTRDNTHHNKDQMLCPWYVKASLESLKTELALKVPPWEIALAIVKLKQPVSPEAIVNLLTGNAGSNLATVEENNHEK